MNQAVLKTTAVVIGVAASVAAFQLLKGSDVSSKRTSHAAIIGEITQIQGQVEKKPARSVNTETVPAPRPLSNQDLIITQYASSAVLNFNTGTSVRLNENSRFVAELDVTRPGTLIGTILDGSATVLNPGVKGMFRLIRDGRDLSLDEPEKILVPSLPAEAVNAALPATNSEGSGGLIITATLPDEAATPAPRPTARSFGDPQESLSNDVLTNDDIIRQLRSQTGFFQRCYLNFIHRTKSKLDINKATGTVVATFVIQPNGKVGDVRIVRSDFVDGVLHNCVTEVIGRTIFKGFRGDRAVPIAEFPITLQ